MICEKYRGRLSKGILLQQDIARVHACKIAIDAVERNGYELIPHPAYSPDLAPSDYFLFQNLKKDIRGCHFWSNEEVVVAVEEWVRDKDPGVFSSGTPLVQVHHSRGQLQRKRRISPRNVRLVYYWLTLVSRYLSHSSSFCLLPNTFKTLDHDGSEWICQYLRGTSAGCF